MGYVIKLMYGMISLVPKGPRSWFKTGTYSNSIYVTCNQVPLIGHVVVVVWLAVPLFLDLKI